MLDWECKAAQPASAIASGCCERLAISLLHISKCASAARRPQRAACSGSQRTSRHLLPPCAAVKAAKAIKRKKQSRLPASYADDFVGYDEEEHVPGHSNKRLRVSAVSEGRWAFCGAWSAGQPYSSAKRLYNPSVTAWAAAQHCSISSKPPAWSLEMPECCLPFCRLVSLQASKQHWQAA